MSFASLITRQQDAIFVRLGEAADYVSIYGQQAGIIIRRVRATEVIDTGQGSILADTDMVKIRRSEVPSLALDDRLFITEFDPDMETDREREYRIMAEPRQIKKGTIWLAEIELVA